MLEKLLHIVDVLGHFCSAVNACNSVLIVMITISFGLACSIGIVELGAVLRSILNLRLVQCIHLIHHWL